MYTVSPPSRPSTSPSCQKMAHRYQLYDVWYVSACEFVPLISSSTYVLFVSSMALVNAVLRVRNTKRHHVTYHISVLKCFGPADDTRDRKSLTAQFLTSGRFSCEHTHSYNDNCKLKTRLNQQYLK